MDELPTRDRLVFAAMKLFGEKGYLSTSVQDILREAGANAGSMYHAFPTKQDLLVAVLEMYRLGIEPMLLAPAWVGIDDPIDKVFALLARYRGLLEATDCLPIAMASAALVAAFVPTAIESTPVATELLPIATLPMSLAVA